MASLVLIGVSALGQPVQAAGRVPYGGELRVMVAEGELPAWQRSLADCYLFRLSTGTRPEPELARDVRSQGDGRLNIRLVAGARFHDGTPIVAEHVVASVRAVVNSRSHLRQAFGLLTVTAVAPHEVTIEAPREIAVRRLFAHPEMAIRHGQVGCGPFSPAGEGMFEAHLGHPRGRPWLDRVSVLATESAATPESFHPAVSKLYNYDVGATTFPSPVYKDRAHLRNTKRRTWRTVIAVPGDAWRGPHRAGARRWVAGKMRKLQHEGLGLDATAQTADTLLPPALSIGKPMPHPASRAPALDQLRIVYPWGRADLRRLSEAVQGTLSGAVAVPPVVESIRGLDVSMATGPAPDWDLALVEVDWSALDAGQAVLEAAAALSLPSLPVEVALGRRVKVKGWLADRAKMADVIPVVHLARPVFHHEGWHIDSGSGSSGGLAFSWERP